MFYLCSEEGTRQSAGVRPADAPASFSLMGGNYGILIKMSMIYRIYFMCFLKNDTKALLHSPRATAIRARLTACLAAIYAPRCGRSCGPQALVVKWVLTNEIIKRIDTLQHRYNANE